MKCTLSKFFLFTIFVLWICSLSSPVSGSPKVLIIQDERPQMDVLAKFLTEKGNLPVTIVDQQSLPMPLSAYKAVIVFIHRELHEQTERSIIDFTKAGGRLVCLHHSISSRKAENKFYFDFLGMQLNKGTMEDGGYAWKASNWM